MGGNVNFNGEGHVKVAMLLCTTLHAHALGRKGVCLTPFVETALHIHSISCYMQHQRG